jgi:hypothetical protein
MRNIQARFLIARVRKTANKVRKVFVCVSEISGLDFRAQRALVDEIERPAANHVRQKPDRLLNREKLIELLVGQNDVRIPGQTANRHNSDRVAWDSGIRSISRAINDSSMAS